MLLLDENGNGGRMDDGSRSIWNEVEVDAESGVSPLMSMPR